MTNISIWHPRYNTDEVLIACRKVRRGLNYITFTKAQTLQGKRFRLSHGQITKCKVESNGRIQCFVVPMSLLRENEV